MFVGKGEISLDKSTIEEAVRYYLNSCVFADPQILFLVGAKMNGCNYSLKAGDDFNVRLTIEGAAEYAARVEAEVGAGEKTL